MNEEEAFLILNSIPNLGAVKVRTLVQFFGSASAALQASSDQLMSLSGFDRVLPHWDKWPENRVWKEDLELAARHRVLLLPFTHPAFPKSLSRISDAPALLYVKGSLQQQDQRSIAVVGTRHASIYGMEMAEKISRELSAAGFTVVSGLARGIDTAAHRGALEGGRTVAVIGSGLADIYPAENRKLADAISERGALMSEFPMITPPDRQNFPQRNRIVSGMTLATLLIEAPLKSGAMITMEKAHGYGRPLFALPGRADVDSFRGNHALIKTGKAQLIEGTHDICAHFEQLFPHPKILNRVLPSLDREERQLLDLMTEEECSIDLLAMRISLPIHQLHRILMSLVLKRMVKEFPGKIFKRNTI